VPALQCRNGGESDDVRESENLRSGASNCGEVESETLRSANSSSTGTNSNQNLFDSFYQWFSGFFHRDD
jgi:hypothetical protein